MTTTTHELEAEKRDKTGTRHATRLRKEGLLPAVLYGHKEATESIAIDAKEAIHHIEAGEKVFTIKIKGGSPETALLKDVQYDYLSKSIIHADFERVNLDEEVEVHIPVHLEGQAKGLKTAGAMVMHPATEIAVRCKVSAMRDSLEIDISDLDVGDTLHAGDIALPAGWELVSEPELVLASIIVKEEEAEGEEVEAEAELAEPEVVGAKEDDEEAPKEEESKE